MFAINAASVRDPAKASALADRGVAVRAGDFADQDALAATFAGADQILIVSADKLGEEALRLHRNAIAAAREAGAGRILYTSHAGARACSSFAPAAANAPRRLHGSLQLRAPAQDAQRPHAL